LPIALKNSNRDLVIVEGA